MKLHFALFASFFAPLAQARVHGDRRLEDFAALDDTLDELKAADSDAGALVEMYHPVFDMDTDSCLPSCAISRSGEKNDGLYPFTSVGITQSCRSSNFMSTSNTYHRWDRMKVNGDDYEVHMFELYFEKDQCKDNFNVIRCGHRHDIETVIMFFTNGVPRYVSVSAHGNYDGDRTRPWSSVPKQGNHPKIVYHEEGELTHALRFASSGENDAENPEGAWVMPPLASWFEMTGSNKPNAVMRILLGRYNYGSATFKIVDAKCRSETEKVQKRVISLGFYMPRFDFGLRGTEVATRPFSQFGMALDYCPDDSILKGLYCFDNYCSTLRLVCSYAQNVQFNAQTWSSYFSEEQGQGSCPTGYVVTAIECRGNFCDDIRLLCKRVSNKSINYDSCFETDWFSEEQRYRSIPSGAFAVGMKCSGSYCDSKKINYCYSGEVIEVNTGWFSDENGGTGYCPQKKYQSILKGLYCSGNYCDKLRMRCTYGQLVQVSYGSPIWTSFFSEEQGLRSCPTDSVVTAIQCNGSYCDNIRLQCMSVPNKSLDYGRCSESDSVSEEEGYREIPDGAYAVGIRCSGAYCDNKKIRYCFDASRVKF